MIQTRAPDREAVFVEFSMVCPNDGPVDVGLEDISSVVVRGEESLEVVFACPRCGLDLRVMAQVPRMLISMLEEAVVFDEHTGERTVSIEGLASRGLLPPEMMTDSMLERAAAARASSQDDADEANIDRYCEYFRRQLAAVTSVEAMLEEIDAK